MKNSFLLVAACLFFLKIGYSQEFQGKAYYQSKTSVGDMSFGGRDMPEEQKKRMLERMKKMFEKTFVLTFDKSAATYLEEEKLEAPTNNGGRMRFGGISAGKLYKNIKEQRYTKEAEMFGKVFLIKDELQKLDWKMGSETKKIGNYTCYKATAIKAIDSTDFASLRRKRENERKKEEAKRDSKEGDSNLMIAIEEPKEIEITAWFTPEIPVSQGPAEYWGLPGLILELNAGNTAILCTKIVLNAEDKEEIKEPTKGKEVNQKEYDKILLEKMEEMSERFRGGGRGGNSNRNRN